MHKYIIIYEQCKSPGFIPAYGVTVRSDESVLDRVNRFCEEEYGWFNACSQYPDGYVEEKKHWKSFHCDLVVRATNPKTGRLHIIHKFVFAE